MFNPTAMPDTDQTGMVSSIGATMIGMSSEDTSARTQRLQRASDLGCKEPRYEPREGESRVFEGKIREARFFDQFFNAFEAYMNEYEFKGIGDNGLPDYDEFHAEFHTMNVRPEGGFWIKGIVVDDTDEWTVAEYVSSVLFIWRYLEARIETVISTIEKIQAGWIFFDAEWMQRTGSLQLLFKLEHILDLLQGTHGLMSFEQKEKRAQREEWYQENNLILKEELDSCKYWAWLVTEKHYEPYRKKRLSADRVHHKEDGIRDAYWRLMETCRTVMKESQEVSEELKSIFSKLKKKSIFSR